MVFNVVTIAAAVAIITISAVASVVSDNVSIDSIASIIFANIASDNVASDNSYSSEYCEQLSQYNLFLFLIVVIINYLSYRQ